MREKISVEFVAFPAIMCKTREIKEPRCSIGVFVTWRFPLKAKTSEVTNELSKGLYHQHQIS
jgi:hypothetical protein